MRNASLSAVLLVAISILVDAPSRAQETAPGPRSPSEEAATFQLADPALVVELVASEPDVTSPVALAWDADGRLYVAEMNDYPIGPEAGRIRRLEDRDGDGRYETSVVFADKLRFPNSVLPFRDGVLVTAAPDLLWLRDSDGDGRAETREVIYTGFGEGNQQLRANGLTWGLDNWIYGANGRNDGEVQRVGKENEPAVSLRASDFRFRPDFSELQALPGQSQFGLAKDDWGERFLSWNTIPIRHALLDAAAVRHSPRLSAHAIRDIADPADRGEVFPIAPRPQTFNAERTDYYNALCGLTILRGGALGEAYRGNAFVGESLTSLVHRRVLVPDGPTFVSQRGEARKEFLAAADPWFHPVFCGTGPDGALYIADFYRRWVEHPQFVADESQRQQVDWREGAAHGRIWRVRRRDSAAKTDAGPCLNSATAAELVRTLEHDNGWHRDTAQRLLVERQDRTSIPILRAMCAHGEAPLTRLHAMYTLDGLNALTSGDVAAGVGDRHPNVRRHAWRALSRLESPEAFWRRLSDAIPIENDPGVQFELAFLLGRANGAAKAPLLAAMSKHTGSDHWVCLAISAGLEDCAPEFLREFASGKADEPSAFAREQLELLEQAAMIATEREPVLEHNVAMKLLVTPAKSLAPAAQRAIFVGLARALASRQESLRQLIQLPPAGQEIQAKQLSSLLGTALHDALDGDAPDDDRILAIQTVALGGTTLNARALLELLSPARPQPIQSATATALGELTDPELAADLFAAWSEYSTSTRQTLAVAALRTPVTAAGLLAAVAEGEIPAVEIDATTRDALLQHPQAAIRAAAEKVLAAARPEPRQQVLEEYQAALTLTGIASHGEQLFREHCASCHVMRGVGRRVGPDLSGIGSRSKENILQDILDPSQQATPNYLSYSAISADGRVYAGLVSAETTESVTLRQAEGMEVTLKRAELESLHASGASLMPAGFEQRLTVQDIADLLAFLHAP